jgi:hypothetical protein
MLSELFVTLAEVPLATTTVGADGEVERVLAFSTMNWVAGSDEVLDRGGMFAVIPAPVIASRTFPVAELAFWCGFHSDGSNQASNVYVGVELGGLGGTVFQAGLKTSLLRYGRFLMPAVS